jgi:hypothetical protein
MARAVNVHQRWWNNYRTERQGQDARYEESTGLDVTETWRQEYRDYFGIGDHAGRPVERRMNPTETWTEETELDSPEVRAEAIQAWVQRQEDAA